MLGEAFLNMRVSAPKVRTRRTQAFPFQAIVQLALKYDSPAVQATLLRLITQVSLSKLNFNCDPDNVAIKAFDDSFLILTLSNL